MNNKVLLVTLLITILVVGCAGRTANPVVVKQYGDDDRSCGGLEKEMFYIQSEIYRLLPDSNKTGKNTALGITGIFLIVPWFFIDLSDAEQIEINAYRQRYNHLLIVAGEKNCGIKAEPIPKFDKPDS